MSDELMEAQRRDHERTQASDILKLRSDMNHLLQPVIGQLRLIESPSHRATHEPLFWQYLSHTIDRLRTALALMDEAGLGEIVSDEQRGKHGLGQDHYPSLVAAASPTADDERPAKDDER